MRSISTFALQYAPPRHSRTSAAITPATALVVNSHDRPYELTHTCPGPGGVHTPCVAVLAASDVLPPAMGIMHELDSKQRCRGVTVPLSGTYMAPASVCASDLSLLKVMIIILE